MNLQTLLQSAIQYHQDGQFEQAEQLYRQILRQDPHQPDALHLLGVLAHQMGFPDEAVQLISQAIGFSPQPHFYNNLGNAYRDTGEHEAAIFQYRQATSRDPDFLPAWQSLAHLLALAQRFAEAAACYRQALRLQPDNPALHNNLGNVLKEQGQLPAAQSHYQEALRLKPDYAMAHLNQGRILQAREQWPASLPHFQDAIRLEPGFVEAYVDLAISLVECGQPEAALAQLQTALQLQPEAAEIYYNQGKTRWEMGQLEAAAEAFAKAVALQPDYPDAHHNLSLVCLTAGHYQQGFQEYEWRWRFEPERRRSFTAPAWEGQDLAGKRILLYAEQGLGDTIQFCRFIPLIARLGAAIVVECQPALVPLLAYGAQVGEVIPVGKALPPVDFQQAFMSLPRVLGTTLETVPGEVPYLGEMTNDECRVTNKRGGATGDEGLRRIGFVWGGNPEHKGDRKRSCPLAYWLPLFELPGIEWYSLQVGERAKELYQLEGIHVIASDEYGDSLSPIRQSSIVNRHSLIDLSPAIQDFADTAAIISQLDLVISVDTAVAHLAGALAKPVWVLLSYIPDWRWMLNRPDSPWYPTATLFRQQAHGDWGSVLEKIRAALHSKAASPAT